MMKKLFSINKHATISFSCLEHKKSVLLLSMLVSLQGCGGGSSGSDPTPTTPKSYAFSLTSTLTNKCGEQLPFVDVELFLQAEDWSTIEKYTPNENGVFSFTTENENINYTLAAKNQKGNKAEGYQLISFYQARTTTPAIYQAQHDEIIDNTNCECIIKNVSLEHATISNINEVTSSAPFVDVTFIDNRNSTYNNVEICRIAGSNWPLHSFSLVGEDNNNEVIGRGVFIEEDFGNETWQAFASEFSTMEYLEDNHQAFSHEQTIKGRRHFKIDVAASDTSIQIFRSHDIVELFRSSAQNIFEERPNLNDYLRTSSKQVITSEVYTTSLKVAAETRVPDAFKDDQSRNELAIKSDGSYNFTSLADFPMAIVKIDFQAINPTTNSIMPVSWITYGPIAGVVPIKATLLGYEHLIDEQSHFRIDNEVIQSASSNTYNDYISFYQNNFDMTFEANLNSYQIITD
ncbi:MAG: hypothetical protein HRT53_12625 [Colwellia sp.]|nr:hypothetical protein [Colwellia sp.]